jgi:hypothetical protein
MLSFWKIIILILVLIYIISPYDILPGFSVFSLIDDAFLMGLLFYYLRYKRLPGFLSWLERLLFGKAGGGEQTQYSGTYHNGESAGGHNRSQKSIPKDPYEIIGVKPGASKKEIQTAYREAVQKYHPDKVSHLGKELQELANRKFVEIQEAYDFLTSEKS